MYFQTINEIVQQTFYNTEHTINIFIIIKKIKFELCAAHISTELKMLSFDELLIFDVHFVIIPVNIMLASTVILLAPERLPFEYKCQFILQRKSSIAFKSHFLANALCSSPLQTTVFVTKFW